MSSVSSHKMLTEESPRGTPLLQGLGVSPELYAKATRILNELMSYQKVIVAFSGGVDSSLMALLAKTVLRDGAIAVTADSPSLPSSELRDAKELADRIGIKHIVVKTDELQDTNYVANPANRCYFCKKELGEKLVDLAKELGDYTIVDGTNAEDLIGHRPGAAALTEGGIRRPLADAGMMKDEVRELAKSLGLPNHDKPSMPCLSSRIAYGEVITPERLLRIERAETAIRSITGVKELRVRDHGSIARIEVGRTERNRFFNEQVLDKISGALRDLGYAHVALDMTGYRSGSMNELSSPVRDRK